MSAVYKGREQTGAKHFILKRYLQTLTFKLLGGGLRELAYIDGFSGPWESATSDFSDTSFMIAIGVLKDAHRHFREKGSPKSIKCFFVEADSAAYKQLAAAVAPYHDPANGFHIETYCGEFEDAVPKIGLFVGKAFALTFIDPTGWTGYAYERISPVLTHTPGEVLINFMYDHVNRFVSHPDPNVIASLDAILGGPKWTERLDPSMPKGVAVEKLFRSSLQTAGSFDYVMSTKVDKSTADRPHFFIAYGTRSGHGLKAFRDVEYDALRGHERNRVEAKQQKKAVRTGIDDLFGSMEMPDPTTMEEIVAEQRKQASIWLTNGLASTGALKFEKVMLGMLQRFMLRETDAKSVCVELMKKGIVVDTWKADGKRTPHDHHIIRLK